MRSRPRKRRCGRGRARAVAAGVAVGALTIAVAAPAGASDDLLFERQWNLTQVGASQAWANSTGAGIRIGIVDTGIDASHPDLAGKVDAEATCVGGPCREGSASDGDGHGTAVSGVAAAITGNGIGIAGVAPDAHLVVAKALGDDGSGTTEDINRGIQWVVDHGARVVNLSLGDPEFELTSRLGTPIQPAIEYAWSRGAIPVLASGNYERGFAQEGSANYGNLDAVVVGSTDKDGGVPSYSTSLGNAKWGIVAPGGNGHGEGADILSTTPGGRYDWNAGTSLATPHVSGALALLLAQGLTPTAAVERLLATADRSVNCGSGCQGRLRTDAAVAVAGKTAVAKQAAGAPAAALGAPTKSLNVAVVTLAILLMVAAGGTTLGTWLWLRNDRAIGT